MSALVLFKEFPAKLKSIVPMLMDQLPHNPKVVPQHKDNEVAFYRATCKLISDLCEIVAVGRDIIPQLTCVLANMDASLTEDLLRLVQTLISFGRLTMNDYIALASSLRIASSVSDTLDVQVCKLKIAALLDEARRHICHSSDYSFLGIVLDGNDVVKSKLWALVQPASA
ncbi:hypothetical protein BJ912DRAFT_1060425 [Pholiota molesta]|nr:hypothetical protein BJ912DRAFT_1060425 [Pholiota molesta]